MHSKKLASLTCVALFAGSAFGLASAAAASAATLNGAGSTLVAPIEADWQNAWGGATGNTVNYSPVGSGSGEKDIVAGQVDFGASDAPLSVYTNVPSNLIQIPWALTATGVSYHINGLRLPRGKNLHLTGSVLAAIYLGQITNWNAPQIRALNKGASIPSTPITVFHRSDGSGDTYAFTRYLSDVSSSFNSSVGSSTTVNFPVGPGAKGNTGMVTALQGTNGGIAYIAVSYLIGARMAAIGIKNAAGNYEVPNLTGIENAAAAFKHVPSDRQLTIVNPGRGAKSAYPISTYTYALVPTNAPQGALLKSFIGYAIAGGQVYANGLDFAHLPKAVVNADRAALNSIS